jgi:signal transduction histidine kinase
MLLLVLIVSIPMHFYISSELENIKFKEQKELSAYANRVANKIYIFSNSNDKIFYFPRSNIYKAAIYKENGEKIFSLLERNIDINKINFTNIDGTRYLKQKLKPNIFDAKYLIVAKKISYAKLILNVITILMVVAFLVFLVLFFIIKQSIEPYKKLNRYQEEFIKDAMHELKTPMGVILLNLDALSSIYSKNKMITRAKSALKNMIVVYEDLEFFVKNKRVKHKKSQIDLSNFVCERVDFFKDLLESKEIKIIKNIEDSVLINFSKLELARVIDNTLSNAIKYSKEKTDIKILVKKVNNNAILEICDEGRGIEDTKKIFKRYYREDKISDGFGLGLSIVKSICDKNGVKIEVKSKIKRGSCFKFIF